MSNCYEQSINIPPTPLRRFVILEHTGSAAYKPGVHWDLLCEEGETLRAWEFPESPFAVPRQTVKALPPHRLIYLDYQGPISGDRGTVRRVAAGTFELLSESPTEWIALLHGEAIQAQLRLSCHSPGEMKWEAILSPVA